MIIALVFIIGSYLLGSIPFALVIGKGIYHTDVRTAGSGNVGTTNVFRVLGKKAGILVYIGDTAKGFLPVFLAARLAPAGSAALVAVLAAGAAIAGHTWSIFLRGKGGKGVAVGGGTIIALVPLIFAILFAVFWLVLLLSRMVSVASLAAALGFSVAVLVTGQPRPYIVFALLGTAVVFYAHRSNIKRLLAGEENRVTFPWNRDAGKGRTAGGRVR
ncbi:MAG: glycerol-3-phosphate 1-O-acyltransferase PlsY [Actinomycetota bacterium]|nr:glycerol-3-phosphate 1-O-acyltransferase PlsY [Actinomycetota bacterium]MCL6093649.1 glycerol-3-phosphate 1-O-acyltransferase PlsY [Actinomycetota bacterium]MDA8166787.1 glycerol-3-phosphate 1-O-acyltransferase PlsY [Actinomycetota bacterium]